MNILFLYTELSGYFLACVKALALKVDTVHIVRWPINSEAPFQFEFPENVKIYNRNDFPSLAIIKLANTINPQIIIASGWIDKDYLKVCRHYKGKIPTVMAMDNQWHGTIKQRIMCLMSTFTIHRYFSHAWVAGQKQYLYATKLGFQASSILEGIYSADVSLFAPEAFNRISSVTYPHRFIYVGRYVNAKGLDLLFSAFTQIMVETESDWELWCAGTGEQYANRIIHSKIKHLGFLQPTELSKILSNSGVFVLPSRFEPWGVVVHEMAAAGFPMILSSAVGSASKYLTHNKNGYIFENENIEDLKIALKKMMSHSDTELNEMAKISHQKGLSYTPELWSQKILNLLISDK